jgi:hypothetical protein
MSKMRAYSSAPHQLAVHNDRHRSQPPPAPAIHRPDRFFPPVPTTPPPQYATDALLRRPLDELGDGGTIIDRLRLGIQATAVPGHRCTVPKRSLCTRLVRASEHASTSPNNPFIDDPFSDIFHGSRPISRFGRISAMCHKHRTSATWSNACPGR